MQDLEHIVAANLAELRRSRGWTQAELAEQINYSDKSVSKWERGEGLPDLKVRHRMAELFNVPLDLFVTENAAEALAPETDRKSRRNYRFLLSLLLVSVIWITATVVFAYAAAYSKWVWMVFIWAIPSSFLVLSALFRRWGYRVTTLVFRSILSWSMLTAVYLQLLISRSINIWMVFLIGIPLQAALILWGQMKGTRK